LVAGSSIGAHRRTTELSFQRVKHSNSLAASSVQTIDQFHPKSACDDITRLYKYTPRSRRAGREFKLRNARSKAGFSAGEGEAPMRFSKEFKPTDTHHDAAPPANKPVPMRPKNTPILDESERLADLKMVARRLGVSPRYVQTLVRRGLIPVIRLGRRCTRFDLEAVLTAVRKLEIQEQGR
jgi:excisionase family DNA binding protein